MFLIALRDTKMLWMLEAVAKPSNWKIIVPNEVFNEVSRREPQALFFLKNKVEWCEISHPNSRILDRLHGLYPFLGKGETDAFAIALTLRADRTNSNVICDDQLARKAAMREGINLMYSLDFFKAAKTLNLMTTDEIRNFMPKLRLYLRLSQKVIQDFISCLEAIDRASQIT